MAEEVDWEAQWSNIVESGQVEDRFSKTDIAAPALPTINIEELASQIDTEVTSFAHQLTETFQHFSEEVQRNLLEDWVKILCDDMKASLLQEEQEENNPAEHSWAEILLPSQTRLPFKDIRKHFGITIHEIVDSITVDNVIGTYSEGKSGEVLVISKDMKFVLKTLSFAEYRLLFTFLPAYLEFVRENPKTLLVRFYAAFTSRGQYYIVMNNIFSTGGGVPREKYDLKGATSNRYTPDEERTKGRTLKDGDLVDAKRRIYVPRDTFQVLSEQLTKDAAFLASQNVMDYSLLLGIIYETEGGEPEDEKDFLERIAAQPVPPNRGITKNFAEILTALSPSITRADAPTTSTTNGQASPRSLAPPSAGIASATSPTTARKFVPATGSTGTNFPNSFSAYNPETQRTEHVCVGIIDMFMYYHEGRALFSRWRALTEDAEEISTVEPRLYAERFSRWMFENAFSVEKEKDPKKK